MRLAFLFGALLLVMTLSGLGLVVNLRIYGAIGGLYWLLWTTGGYFAVDVVRAVVRRVRE